MEKRKLVTIIVESSIERQIIEDVKRLGAHGYTIVEARGEGARGSRAADWDLTTNTRMEIICDEQTANAIAQHVMKSYAEHYATVVYISDVEVFRPKKF